MKRKQILNLIKAHFENDNDKFIEESLLIAKNFEESDKFQVSNYIKSLVSSKNTFSIQSIPNVKNQDFKWIIKDAKEVTNLYLPTLISNDIKGIINSQKNNVLSDFSSLFLFEGNPGTGKTETVRYIAQILKYDLYLVQIENLIDSKLGQTSKNIKELFNEISQVSKYSNAIILFDEFDAIALSRFNDNDTREMGRVVSTMLKEIDNVDYRCTIIATTNMKLHFDKALLRRFLKIVNFDRYTQEELKEISYYIYDQIIDKFPNKRKNKKMFEKIINLVNIIPYPSEIKNIIFSSILFSDDNNNLSYFKQLYENLNLNYDIKELYSKDFTLRELEILFDVSRSTISRRLNEK